MSNFWDAFLLLGEKKKKKKEQGTVGLKGHEGTCAF